ncbi:hypothetical protein CBL_02852 [Carabus blaptoides fortunei]
MEQCCNSVVSTCNAATRLICCVFYTILSTEEWDMSIQTRCRTDRETRESYSVVTEMVLVCKTPSIPRSLFYTSLLYVRLAVQTLNSIAYPRTKQDLSSAATKSPETCRKN